MKEIRRKEQEKGQIIILLAVSMVVVMVVAALAVDGGMIYTERRFAQNAADSAAFAGGGAILNSGELDKVLTCPVNSSHNLISTAVSKAILRAEANNISGLELKGYEINNKEFQPNENQGIWVVCNDQPKPITIDVIVRVTSQVSTAFAHLIYPGPLQTTNESVVTVNVGKNSNFGNALVALGEGCGAGSGGITVGGSALLKIFSGGAFSNSCFHINGDKSGSINNNPWDNDIYSEGGFSIVAKGTSGKTFNWLDPYVYGGQTFDDDYPAPPINPGVPSDDYLDCSDLDVMTEEDILTGPNGEDVYPSGIWDITNNLNKDTVFKEGLFCISGDIKFNGNAKIEAVDVTIYMIDGEITLNGNSKNTLVAPTNPTDDYYNRLFYFAGSGGTITFNGTNESYFSGQVYAPEMSLKINGTSDTITMDKKYCSKAFVLNENDQCEVRNYTSQFIAKDVEVTGNGKFEILYNGHEDGLGPANLYLQK
jgi:hypothetical protein